MEFVSVRTAQHIIEPIGYGIARKTVRVGAQVLSATEQFVVQSYAAEFPSISLFIPKPIRLESTRSYTMEMIHESQKVAPLFRIEHDRPFLFEIARFVNYMYLGGYFVTGYDIFALSPNTYVLVGFSRTGFIQKDCVRFPKLPYTYTLAEAQDFFGLKLHLHVDEQQIAPLLASGLLSQEQSLSLRSNNPISLHIPVTTVPYTSIYNISHALFQSKDDGVDKELECLSIEPELEIQLQEETDYDPGLITQ